ncbi:MAG: phosphoglycolate phosphatase [Desulfurococcales archaeon]|nr:phosphoglycolate phosphatase [Desulfurococcales archaeon]
MIKLVVSDVDGTITVGRTEFPLDCGALEAVREAGRRGVIIALSSGNSLPVIMGLSRYTGAMGPVIAENGCIIYYKGNIVRLCKGRPPDWVLGKMRELGLEGSWQNRYRDHDIAFPVPLDESGERYYRMARKIVEESGWDGRVLYSGFAVHLQPPGGGKGKALVTLTRMLGLKRSQVLAIGDSKNDIEMLVAAGSSAVPSNADEEAKAVASYIASKPSGEGFKEIIGELVLGEVTHG